MYINCDVPFSSDVEKFKELIHFLYRIGYQAAIVNVNSIKEYRELLKTNLIVRKPTDIGYPVSIKTLLKYKVKELPIPLIPKITIHPKNAHKLKNELGSVINFKTLVAVETTDKNTLEVAARDGRVDSLSVPTAQHQKALSKGILSLARQNDCVLAINISHLIFHRSISRTRDMRTLYRLIMKAKVNSYKYALGSFIGNPWNARGPKENIAMLVSLFDVPEFWAKSIVATNSEELVLRFIKRDLGLFIESGTEIVFKKEPPKTEKQLHETKQEVRKS